jgi:hypothetical protein
MGEPVKDVPGKASRVDEARASSPLHSASRANTSDVGGNVTDEVGHAARLDDDAVEARTFERADVVLARA